MFKKLSAILSTATLGLTTVAVLAPVSVSSVSATTTSGLYKLVALENTEPNSMFMAENNTGYEAQSRMADQLKNASIIDVDGYGYPQGEPRIGCAVISGGLKCWGNENSSGHLGDETRNVPPADTLVTATRNSVPISGVTSISRMNGLTCVVASGDLLCIGATVDIDNIPRWTTELSGVKKVKLQGDAACAVLNNGEVKCASRASMSVGSQWTTVVAGGATDIDAGFFNSRFCVAGSSPVCFQYMNGQLESSIEVVGVVNPLSVYSLPSYMDTVCFHDGSILYCGSLINGQFKMREIAVMEAPRSIIYAMFNNGPSNIYLVMPTGLLSFSSLNFTCATCGYSSSSGFLPLKKFTASTETFYNNLISINAATNSQYFIPMTVETGSRNSRSLVSVRLVTESGIPIANSSVRWSAPDFSRGVLGSSTSSNLKTDAAGNARSTLFTGPITFTLTGGTIPNGATLHAASITIQVPTTGSVTATVPDPPPVVDRTVRVVMPDGGEVPSATIAIRNNFLSFAYQNSGSSTSTWSSQPADTNNYFGITSCIYCYAPPPVYLTGEKGTVTFKSFNPSRRNGSFDAAVRYDDGDLNQVVQATFSGLDDTVRMPFMARLSTPIQDTNPSTPEIEIGVKNGAVDIEVDLKDDSNLPVSDFVASAEVVCPVLQTGGLVPADTTAANATTRVCSPQPTFPPGYIPPSVRPFNVCMPQPARTNINGRGAARVCAISSQLYRVRGAGALPSRTFCAVVNGKACVSANSAAAAAGGLRTFKAGRKVTLRSAGVTVKKGSKVKITINRSSRKICAVDKSNNFIGLKNGVCSASVRIETKSGNRTKKQTKKVSFAIQANTISEMPLNVKGARPLISLAKANGLYITKSTKISGKVSGSSKKVCTLRSNTVNGVRAGICKISLEITHKGLPKTTETISVTVG